MNFLGYMAKTGDILWRMTDEQRLIFDQMDMEPVRVFDWKDELPKMYDRFNAKWFNDSLPPISPAFVCEFCDMPREFAGICIDKARAAQISKSGVTVRLGVRINSNLQCLSDHVEIALLHEMVHASGIQKHEKPFQNAVADLFRRCRLR